MRKLGLLGCFVFLSMMIAMPVTAGTLDGLTPAEETTCDPLREDGVTKGLYGLCVAFCEAQDLASEQTVLTYEDLEALGGDAPSGRILANYNKKKQEGDPGMPCILNNPCPCFSENELKTIDGYWDGDGFVIVQTYGSMGGMTVQEYVPTEIPPYSVPNTLIRAWVNKSIMPLQSGNQIYWGEQYNCGYTNKQIAPAIFRNLSSAAGTLSLNQYEACYQNLHNR